MFNYILLESNIEELENEALCILCVLISLIFLLVIYDVVSPYFKNNKIKKAQTIIESLTIDDFVIEYLEKTKYISLNFPFTERIRKIDGRIYTKRSVAYEYGYSLLIRKDNITFEIEDELNEFDEYTKGINQIEVNAHELCIYLNEDVVKKLKKLIPIEYHIGIYLTQKYQIGRYCIPWVPYENININVDDFTYKNEKEYYVEKIKGIIKTELRRMEVYRL